MDKKQVVKKLKAYRKLLDEHLKVEDVYLFGSYANNTSTEDSDIDVAVVVDKIEKDFFDINPVLWKLRRQIDDRIEPILIEKEHDDGGFLSEIKKKGIKIT